MSSISAFSKPIAVPPRRPRHPVVSRHSQPLQASAVPPRPSKVRPTKLPIAPPPFKPSPLPSPSPMPPTTPTTPTPSKCSSTDFGSGFVSVKEIHGDVPLIVTGRLPTYLQGNMYRVGPGIFDVKHADGQTVDKPHWFDGLGVVIKFGIDGTTNEATFKCRSICPEQERAIRSTPKNKYKDLSFGAAPGRRGWLDNLRNLFKPLTKDPVSGEVPMNINVTLEQFPGKAGLVARSDFARNIQLDADTLDFIDTFDFSELNPKLKGMAAAAHSAVDEETGELFNFSAGDWRNPGKYRVFRVGSDGKSDVLAEIQASPNCHIHALTLTTNLVTIAISPWSVDIPTYAVDCALVSAMRFNDKKCTEFFVIDRKHGRVVARYETPAFAAFHYVNAYEDERDDKLHVDVCRYDRADVLKQFYLSELRTKDADWFTPVKPVRYTMHGVRGAATAIASADAKKRRRPPVHRGIAWPKELTSRRMELPAVADSVTGRKYRYCYGVSHEASHDDILANALVKLDVRTGEEMVWTALRTCIGEPLFVPDPAGVDEDDGVILTVVVEAAKRRSAMVVLDARTMREVARAVTPCTVPHAFHSLYVGKT